MSRMIDDCIIAKNMTIYNSLIYNEIYSDEKMELLDGKIGQSFFVTISRASLILSTNYLVLITQY